MARGSGGASASQAAFAGAVAGLLRQSRQRQRLTQALVAARTGGIVSKAALANYETGHRSLRVDVFWVLARALGEDAGALLAGAERETGFGAGDCELPVTVDLAEIMAGTDDRLAPVRRWVEVRLAPGAERLDGIRTLTLDHSALTALAALMDVSTAECRRLLLAHAVPPARAVPPVRAVRSSVPAPRSVETELPAEVQSPVEGVEPVAKVEPRVAVGSE